LGAALAIMLPHLGELVITRWRELDVFLTRIHCAFLGCARARSDHQCCRTPVDKAESELNLAFAMNETVPYKLAKWAKNVARP